MSNLVILDEFNSILQELQEMHDKKSKDYGTDGDPYANVCASSGFGVEPWVGALIREHDKTTRIQSFLAKGSLANESLEDSLIDKAVYSIIALLLYRRTQRKAPEHKHDWYNGMCVNCQLMEVAYEHAYGVVNNECGVGVPK